MGTRSITILKNNDTEIAVLYGQYDGYPEGHGQLIVEALGGKEVVNGYSSDNQINGAGDMAVQLISFMKASSHNPVNTPGTYYLYPPGTRNCGQDYTYTVTCVTGPLRNVILVQCEGYSERDSFPEGTLDEFSQWLQAALWCDKEDEDDEED